MTKYRIEDNTQYSSKEVYFDGKPERNIIDGLKSLKMRWNHTKMCWYGFPDTEKLNKLLGGETVSETVKNTEFDFDVKVGDLFYSSWGYEQTNVDFFQVVALVGKKSVRVKEVFPKMLSEDPTCSMAADRTYEVTNELLPAIESSVFIKDQEHGDLKRLKSWAQDGKSNPLFDLSSFASAHKYTGQKLYESWYA